jgi:hypothetical protein
MRILREPLVHFLAIGAAIFALSQFMGRGSGAAAAGGATTPTDKQIVVTPEKVALLKSGYVLDNGRDPTDADLQRLIDAYIREEILVREARAQGLDRDDSIVRRRLVQKMEFAVADPAPPPDSELEKYLAQNPAPFRTSDGKVPPLAEIHGAVLATWMNDQRKLAIDEMYRNYKSQYQISVAAPAATMAGGKGGGG